MARQPIEVGGDYVMVGDSSDDSGGITIDDRRDADIKAPAGAEDRDDWDDLDNKKPPKKPATRERPQGSVLGGRDPEGDDDGAGDVDHGNGDDDSGEDVRLAYDDPDDLDAPRERVGRRARRNRSKRAAIDSRDAVIETLQERLARAEQITSGIAGGQFMSAAREINQRIAYAESSLAMAGAELAKAIKEGDGDAWAEIDKARTNAQQELWGLQQSKLQIEARARETFDEQGNLKVAQPAAPGGRDPHLQRQADRKASIFQDRFSWFDPNGNTKHDRIVKRIDREIAREGLEPHDNEFWHEFEDRMREAGYRPGAERPDDRDPDDETYYNDERPARRDAEERRPNRPPTGAARPSRPGNDRQGAQLDATQNDALRQLGLLEEPGEPPIRLDEADTKRRDNIVDRWLAAKKQQRR